MWTLWEGGTRPASELAGVVTSDPAPAPSRLPPRRSRSGSSWLQAGPHGCTRSRAPRQAASLSRPPSLLPPAPLLRPRTHCAAGAAQSAARTGTSAGPPPPLPAPPGAPSAPSRLTPALPHGTQRKQLAINLRRPPEASPGCLCGRENELMPRVQPPPFCLLLPLLPLPSHTRAHTRHLGRVSVLRPSAWMGVFISEGGRARGAR